MELKEQIKIVAEARVNYSKVSDLLKQKREEFESSYTDLINTVNASRDIVATAEEQLRISVLGNYRATKEKNPAEGVAIREMTKYDYEPAKALLWAKEHNLALKLDDSAFKKIIKADTPDFVTVTIEPQATIATDLSEYLKELEED
jgi:hypothetical protein